MFARELARYTVSDSDFAHGGGLMAKKLKVPKRIAGVKIPKVIRKGPVGDFLNSSGGQLLVAEAVLLAGGALMANRTDSGSTAGHALRHPWRQIKSAAQAIEGRNFGELGEGGDRIRFALGEAIRAFRNALGESGTGETAAMDGAEEADPALGAEADAERSDGSTKKKSRHHRSGSPEIPH
jgi:hypothetical protein